MNAAPNDVPPRQRAPRNDPMSASFSVPNRSVVDDVDPNESRAGYPLDPYRVWSIARGHVKALSFALVLGTVLAIVGFVAMPQTYVATSTVRYVSSGPDGVNERGSVMSAAIEATDDIDYLADVGRNLHVPAGAVLGRLELVPEMELGLLRIKARAKDAGHAAEIANAAANALLTHLTRLERAAAQAEVREIEGRINGEAASVERVRATYDEFRRANGIMDLATERTQQIDSAANLRSQRDLAQADIEALEARVGQLRRDLARTPRMVAASSSTTSTDQMQLARLEGELASARSTYSDDHPTVRSLELQIASTRRRIDSGHGSATTAVTMGSNGQYQMLESSLAAADAELAAARERSSSIDQLATNASERVTAFTAVEGQATELLSDVRTHEALLGELRERRARLDARLRHPDPRFTLASPATRPLQAEKSAKKRLVIAAAPLVLFFGVFAFFLVRDLGRGRMRTPSEIAYWSRMPVIAATDWPRNLRALEDLVADMDDWAARADGVTMLVPLGDRELPLVSSLAERLDSGWTRQDPPVRVQPVAPASPSVETRGPVRATPTIIVTPPPSHAPAARELSTGLVRTSRAPLAIELYGHAARRRVVAWEGGARGPKLRRESRLADRVAVVVSSGHVTVRELVTLQTRLGRSEGVAIIVVDLAGGFVSLPDRVGPIESFWNSVRVDS